jgi:hypothetical protein
VRRVRQTMLPKYDATALHEALDKAFGDKPLGASRNRLVIPTFDHQRRDVHVFKTSHHDRLRMDWSQRAVDVALATTAAPTYFPGHRLDNGVSLVDGGIWANNPLGIAVVEAIGVLGWSGAGLHVLSLGCSEAPIRIPEKAGKARLARKIEDIFLLGQSRGAYGTAKLLMGSENVDRRLLRVQPAAAQGEFDLDGVRQIPSLKGMGTSLARIELQRVKDIFLDVPCSPFVPFHPQR